MKRLLTVIFVALLACDDPNNGSDAYGNFESEELFLSTEIRGKLLSVFVKEGDRISRGDEIALVDSMPLYLEKKQVEATIRAMHKKLQHVGVQIDVFTQQEKVLKREVQRISNLLESGAATQKQLDDLQGELEVIQKRKRALSTQLTSANRSILAEIDPLEWKLKMIRDQIDRCRIRAPMDGTVLNRYKAEGEYVLPGQPIVKLAQLDEMNLRVYISGNQLSSVEIGQKVSVLIDGEDGEIGPFEGTIRWVASEAEFTPKSIQTKAERVNQVYAMKVGVKNDGSLKVGMPAEVRF